MYVIYVRFIRTNAFGCVIVLEGIRFRNDLGEKIDDKGVEEVKLSCKGKHCSGKEKRKLSSRVKKETHHWLPRIHEDYYGPRMHRPKHH